MRLPGEGAAGAAAVAVRDATPADIESIAVIERASFSDPWSASSFRSLLDDERVLFRVAHVGGEIVGYVVAWFLFDEAEIANLAVRPASRGLGLGAALLDVVLREGRARHTAVVYLEVRDSNAPARALYLSRGFAEVARRPRYYRRPVEDAVVMRRLLDAGASETAQRK